MHTYTTINDNKNIFFIIILIALLFISPLLSLVLAVLRFRSKAAYPLFIFFAFYFGWFYYFQFVSGYNDLMGHYAHFKTLIGKSLWDSWMTSSDRGREPYPVLFKYLVGKVSSSPNLFSACACTIYAALFCGMLSSIRDLYIQKMDWLATLTFLGIIFSIEFYWFLGLRYWSGAFVFVLFYIRYVRTGRKKYLYLSFLCILFHFAHVVLCLAVLLNELLRNNFKLRYLLVGLGLVFRYLKTTLKYLFINLFPIVNNFSGKNYEVESTMLQATSYLTSHSPFYFFRKDVLFFACLFVLIILYIHDKKNLRVNPKLWGMILVLYAFANFGSISIVLYERVFKVVILLLYIYLYIYLMESDNYYKNKKLMGPIIILGLAILYAFLTPIVQQRNSLFRSELWFNNWF